MATMMAMTLEKTEAENALAQAFAAAQACLPGGAALVPVRARAFEAFAAQGLPHRRVEDWKYTDLRSLMRTALPIAPAPDGAAIARAEKALAAHALPGARRLVLVDGHFVPQLSDLAALESGLTIRPLAQALASGGAAELAVMPSGADADPLVALNAALMGDGVVIAVADGIALTRPLHLVHVASGAPAAMTTRSRVQLGRQARATLVEQFIGAIGDAAYQVNDAVAIVLDAHARLDHSRFMEDSAAAINITTLAATLAAHARLTTFNLTSGGAVSRYQAFLRFDGEGAQAETGGVNLLTATQHGDTTMFLDHAVPACSSREIFRAVLDNRARSVFQGRILVRPVAQKTDARMMIRALLLSDEAESDSKPELEIYADDVACGHGSTSGALDEGLLFYLRARGLPETEAQALLIQAFVGEAIELIADEQVRTAALAAAARYLAARRT
jgi:Fe-S cluster assembly protein SufD